MINNQQENFLNCSNYTLGNRLVWFGSLLEALPWVFFKLVGAGEQSHNGIQCAVSNSASARKEEIKYCIY